MSSNYELALLDSTSLVDDISHHITSFLTTSKKVNDEEYYTIKSRVNNINKIVLPSDIKRVTNLSFDEEVMLNKYTLNNHFKQIYVYNNYRSYKWFLENFWNEICVIEKDLVYYTCKWNIKKTYSYPIITYSIKYHIPYEDIIIQTGLFKDKSVKFVIDTLYDNTHIVDISNELLHNNKLRKVERQALQSYYREKRFTPKKVDPFNLKDNIKKTMMLALDRLNNDDKINVGMCEIDDDLYGLCIINNTDDCIPLFPCTRTMLNDKKLINDYTELIYNLHVHVDSDTFSNFTLFVDETNSYNEIRYSVSLRVSKAMNYLSLPHINTVYINFEKREMIQSTKKYEASLGTCLITIDSLLNSFLDTKCVIETIDTVYKKYVYYGYKDFALVLKDVD